MNNNVITRMFMNFSKTLWNTATTSENVYIRAACYESLWNKMNPIKSGENYLDIAAGDLVNTEIFGKYFKNTFAMDVHIEDKHILRAKKTLPNINISFGDAHNLDFQDNTFDVVTMISVIEHVKYPEQSLKEAIRVLKPGGELVLQIPNKWFPIEPHTGIPLVWYYPKSIRDWGLRKLGYSYYIEYCPGFPTRGAVKKYINNTAILKDSKIVIIPFDIVPQSIRPLYKLAVITRVAKIIPQSWLAVYDKTIV